MNLKCAILNKVIYKVFWKPHYKRSNIFFLFKKKGTKVETKIKEFITKKIQQCEV